MAAHSISNADLTQASSLTTSTDGKYTVTGDGIFDDLMEAVNTHLSAQFNLGRITGNDYATVYLGALQGALQSSVQFILSRKEAAEKAALLEKQVLTETSNKELVDVQKADVINQGILRTQSTDSDLSIKRQQIISEAFQNGMEVNEYIWEIEYVGNLGETYTYVTNENLTDNDVIALMTADPHDSRYPAVNAVTLSITNNIQHAGKSTAGTIIAKTQEEVDLLKQKRITEHAQTLTEAIGFDINTSSLMGKQSELFTQQADGFKNDAKNAFNKNIADIIKMQMNTSGDFTASKYLTVEHLLDVYKDDDNIVAATN
jgi:hypothetical protein